MDFILHILCLVSVLFLAVTNIAMTHERPSYSPRRNMANAFVSR